MGRRYTAVFSEVAVTAAQDLFEVVAPSDAIVVVHEFGLFQTSDVADAQEEILHLALKSGQTTSGSGGSTPTPVPIELGDAAFGGTVEANNTTKASTGTIVSHGVYGWNVRAPYEKIYTPETCPILSPGRRATLELVNAPADSLTMSGYITFEEIGG